MITHALLVSIGACVNQREKFDQEWPKGGEVTIKNALRAIEIGLDLDWFAVLYFPFAIRKVYVKAVDQAWQTYNQAKDEAWSNYFRDPNATHKERMQSIDLAEQVKDLAKARAFVRGYNQTIKARKR